MPGTALALDTHRLFNPHYDPVYPYCTDPSGGSQSGPLPPQATSVRVWRQHPVEGEGEGVIGT